jgi:hypothetical protein
MQAVGQPELAGLAMEADTGVGDTVYYGGTTQQSARV